MQNPVAPPRSAELWRGRPPQNEVPQTKRERDRLLRATQDYARSRVLVPPLSMDELRLHSESVLRLAGLDGQYSDYASVLVSNEAWAESVARVPYARRLLLLPQCLRVRERCSAPIDEFGLVCKHCGSCEIHHLQTEAERLGYVVLVAEGTVVVTSLIESRKLEAIIGVSCLSGLERVFPYMEAAAIPGLAIPLLQNGCVNTSVDLDWVWDAIHLSSDDRTRRLDLDTLRARVESWFAVEALDATLGPAHTETERIARAWLARSGKRWRPFLAVCAFHALQEEPEAVSPDGLRKIAVAVECFHKASLVHDDIEDNDHRRYGERTLHEEFGVPVALNVGDLLLGEGYRLIAECDAPAARKAEMLRVATGGHCTLCIGQGEELTWRRRPQPLTTAKVLDIFRQKTAPAFEVALRLGALYGSGDGDLWGILSDYSEALGIAYQIRDDLEDFAVPCAASEAGEGDGAASPSVLLALAHERSEGRTRGLIEALWQRSRVTEALTPELREALASLNVEAGARQLLEAYKDKAVRSLRALENANLKGLLRRVVARIFNEIGA